MSVTCFGIGNSDIRGVCNANGTFSAVCHIHTVHCHVFHAMDIQCMTLHAGESDIFDGSSSDKRIVHAVSNFCEFHSADIAIISRASNGESFQGNIVCLYHNARLSGNRIGAGVNDNFAGIGTICTFNGQALCLNPQLLICSSCIGAFSECNGVVFLCILQSFWQGVISFVLCFVGNGSSACCKYSCRDQGDDHGNRKQGGKPFFPFQIQNLLNCQVFCGCNSRIV